MFSVASQPGEEKRTNDVAEKAKLKEQEIEEVSRKRFVKGPSVA